MIADLESRKESLLQKRKAKSLTRMSSDQNPDEPPESPLPKVKTILLAHAIAAEDRPALEHLLISFWFPSFDLENSRLGTSAMDNP
jgi:hypothetical protein